MVPKDYHKMLRNFQKHGLYKPQPSKYAYLNKNLNAEELKKRKSQYRKKWLKDHPQYNNKYWHAWYERNSASRILSEVYKNNETAVGL